MTEAVANYKLAKDNHQLSHIPGSFGWPLIGHTISLVKDLYGTIDKQYKEFGPVSKFGLAGFKGVLLCGPDLYQQVYLDKEKNFSAEMGYMGSLGRFYKGALLLRDHEEHRFQRRMMQTAFKNDAMKGYIDTMGPMLAEAVESWDGQEDFHFFPAIKQALLDVAATIFVGLEKDDDRAEKLNQAFTDVANGLMGLVTKEIPGTLHAKGKKGERYLHEFFGSLIQDRRNNDGKDTFSYFAKELNEDGEYFSDQDIVAHMSFLLFAAHDTTTSALSHMLYHLGQNPELRQRLREEAQAIGKDYLEYEDLDKMPLADAAVREALRLHPSVMMMQRRTIKDCEIGGYHIPANTILFLAPQYVHRMPEYWDEPEKFDPDRWLEPRNEHKRHSFSFVGFGGGAHKCIGMHFALMQTKNFLHQFLTRYDFELPANFGTEMQTVPLPKPADDLPMVLKRLNG
ncbi:cytochrome P450 [Litorivivens lipolytica]|uniref:Cytochrome P450 n=1 Tax=Litorivivens lipolytica TaxID=1524264 RepID=A0A7W4W6G0_9GAMM|nr:cytochrome P450 [Litorivivens lipolytica]MBB3048309.1 cytochrome P450 [Litorivivens lipolytica]